MGTREFVCRMVLALAVVSALASGASPAAEIAAEQEASGAIRVVVPSVFETTFTKRKGFGATWFDLAHDPKKERDIAPVLDENGFFWVKLGKPGTDASWYANPAEEMELLEAGPARVRIQTRGPHTRYGNADRAAQWKECRYKLVFTLYPTGNVYIAYTLEQGEPVPYRDFRVITKSTGAWGENGGGAGKNEVRVAGEAGPARPSRDNKTETAFALQWSNGPTYFTDILMVAYKGKYGAAYWNEGFQDKDMRTSLDLGGLWPDHTLPAGKVHLQFLMCFRDDINGPHSAKPYAEDYRSPDVLGLAKGEIDKTDEGDWDGDGFNEEEGCYVLMSGKDGVAFSLHGAKVPRMNPVFKVKRWAGTAPQAITVDHRGLATGREFVASAREGLLLVQLLGKVEQEACVEVSARQLSLTGPHAGDGKE